MAKKKTAKKKVAKKKTKKKATKKRATKKRATKKRATKKRATKKRATKKKATKKKATKKKATKKRATKKKATKKKATKKRATKKKATKKKATKKRATKKKAVKKKATGNKLTKKQPTQAELALAAAELHAASLKELVAQNAAATQALVEQSAAATAAMLRSTELLERVLGAVTVRVESLEASLESINEKLDMLLLSWRREGTLDEVSVAGVVPPSADISILESPAIAPPTVIERKATKLSHLLRIRAANQSALDKINGNLGTALGFSGNGVPGEPAIILFVPPALHAAWRDGQVKIAERLFANVPGEGRVSCAVDVEVGKKPTSQPELPAAADEITRRLSAVGEDLRPGSQLVALNENAELKIGSLGLFVGRKSDKVRGFITNDHVAFPLSGIYYPMHPSHLSAGIQVGLEPDKDSKNRKRIKTVSPGEWYGDFAFEENAEVHVDCEFVKLELTYDRSKLTNDLLSQGGQGDLFTVNLQEPMGSKSCVLGKRVMKIGRTTGLTRGTVRAFAYEWHDDLDFKKKRYTDLLIQPESGRPFSQPGDSGSLVVLEEGLQPLALLWGGMLEQLGSHSAQTNWTYATRLSAILKHLEVKIFR